MSEGRGFTGREACELIAAHWRAAYGLSVAPEEVWGYSPTGELYRVFAWLTAARDWQRIHRALPAPTG